MGNETAPSGRGPRMTRKQALRSTGLALVGSGLAAGWAPGASAAARRAAVPRRAAAAPTVVSITPDAALNMTEWALIEQAIAPLLAAHPGLKVQLFESQYAGHGGALETFMVGGEGPDIFGDFILTGYTASDLALDLTPFVRQDNVDLTGFMQGQLQYIHQAGLQSPTNPGGLYALPCLTNPTATVVNLGILDQLGLTYPEPGWTYKEWARLWQSSTRKSQGSTPARAGGVIDWRGYDHTYNMISPWVFKGWGGEYVDPKSSTTCYLSNPKSIACAEWAYDLYWSGVVNPGAGDSDFQNGLTVTHNQDSDDLPNAARLYRGLKWDFFALPVWPVETTSYTSANFDGIWAGTKNPDAAWIVLKWLTTTATWQTLQMHTLLYAPSRLDMYEQWIATVRQVAPPLRNKNLDIYLQQAQANNQYVGDLFRYQSNAVKSVIGTLSSNLSTRKTTVAAGFAQASRQIDALEVAGKSEAGASARFEAKYQREMKAAAAAHGSVQLSAPARAGAGVPPVKSASQVIHKGSTWQVTGGGGGVHGHQDGLTFACAVDTSSMGTFVCRVAGISAVHPTGKLNDGAKFGLMVRGDLSDDAPSVGVEVAAGRGVHFHSQPFAGQNMIDQRAGVTPGLLAAGQILADDTKPAVNYLKVPVWLKLVRDVTQWTAYTSLDGKTWAQAGVSAGAQIAGCWVGLYVTAHGNGDLARAQFDNVSGFTPDTFVRIGTA